MKHFALAASALFALAAAASFAQSGEENIPVAPSAASTAQDGRPHDMFEDADTDGDGSLSAQEFIGRAEAHFKEMDMDSDGLVTPDEMHALSEKKRVQMQLLMRKESTDSPLPAVKE